MKNIKYLLFDFETSDLYNKKLPPAHVDQAWPVQIGALYLDKDLNILSSLKGLLQPPHDEAFITDGAYATHNIPITRCIEEGMSIIKLIDFLIPLFQGKVDRLIGHNVQFDIQFLYRYALKLYDLSIIEALAKTAVCTMRAGTNECKLPATESMKNFKGLKDKYKSPKLEELYKHLFNKSFGGAHDAMEDVLATLECLKELVKRGVIIL